MDVSREAVAWGLLFGLPPGIGAGMHVSMVEGSSTATGVAFGGAIALVLFLVIVGAATLGEGTGDDAPESETP